MGSHACSRPVPVRGAMVTRKRGPVRRTVGAVCLSLLVAGLVSGCGTDLPRLLEEDSGLHWEVDEILSSDEGGDLAGMSAFDRAEIEKSKACGEVYRAANQRMELEMREGPPPLHDAFFYDLGLLVVFLVPIDVVERCREAIHLYRTEIAKLRDELTGREGTPISDNRQAGSGG